MDAVALCTLPGLSLVAFIVPLLWWLPHSSNRANKYLALFVVVIGISLLQTFLLHSGLTLRYPWVSGLGQFFYFALGPLLYCYTRALSDRHFVFSVRQGWHFLPVLISFIVYLPVYLQTSEVKRYIVDLYFSNTSTAALERLGLMQQLSLSGKIYIVQFVALMLQLAAYAVLILKQLRNHRTTIELEFSSIELINLNWMRWLNYLVLLVTVASLLFLSMRLFSENQLWPDLRIFPVLMLILLVYFTAWMAVRQPKIYGTALENGDPPQQEAAAPGKYQTTGLTAGDAKVHWQRLQLFMEKEQPYLYSGLTLKQLAGELALSSAHLSQVINSYAQVNFFDYINLYRINHSQQLLADPQDQTRKVLDIALSSGFSSQSTFYAQFRKHAGCTPSQYRNRLVNSR